MSKVILTPQASNMLDELFAEIATFHRLNNINKIGEGFSIAPTHQQTLHEEITESDGFLKQISRYLVNDLSAEKIGMEVGGFIGKRTDTELGHDRKAFDPTDLTARNYYCNESEYDTLIKWSKINMWTNLGRKRFYEMWKKLKNKQTALSLISTGFYGQYTAKETANAGYSDDANKYPRGEDFHEGWLQYFIRWAPEKVWGLNPDGTIAKIKLGISGETKGDFVNLDELIADYVSQIMPTQYQDMPEQRAIIGKELVNAEYLRIYRHIGDDVHRKPSINDYINKHEFGQIKGVITPLFPKRGIFFSPLKNFAIYEQLGSLERSIEKNKHRKCIEDFTFMNEDFVLENIDYAGMIHPDAIQTPDGAGGWKDALPQDKWAVEIPSA